MNTNTKSAHSASVDLADADADAHPVDTEADPSAVATRCSGADSPPRGGRRRMRGDVRAAVLVLLEESPRNGYQIIQEFSERSNGAWRPSPGSVYPVLQQLEDEGLVEIASTESGKTFHLTAKGKTLVETQRDALGKPWEEAAAEVSDATSDLYLTLRQMVSAVRQVGIAGSEAQTRKAVAILADTRKAIYRLLADDES